MRLMRIVCVKMGKKKEEEEEGGWLTDIRDSLKIICTMYVVGVMHNDFHFLNYT